MDGHKVIFQFLSCTVMLGHEGKEDWIIDEDKRAAKILDEAKQWLVDQPS